jgi:glycosyltransferase involved in cell wall biosynthesis
MQVSIEVSIIVRSYNRHAALCDLLDVLLGQDHPDFEIVVVEQSDVIDATVADRLARLLADPRVRVLRHGRLGSAKARNTGVRAARGEFLLFMDDDDVPEGTTWIEQHLASYADPKCLGVSGRQKNSPDEENPYAWKALAHWRCQDFSPLLKLPWTYVRQNRRKQPVGAVIGSNGSLRRSAVERFGLWDEDTAIEDEASFGLRAAQRMAPGEYFAFDPIPVIRRGIDVQGGMQKRFITTGPYYRRVLDFVHRIIGRYHPARVLLLWPLYVLAVYGWTVTWIWSDSRLHKTLPRRIAGTLGLLPLVPVHALWCAARALRPGPGAGWTDRPREASGLDRA